jgi:hypothetical protein
MKNICICVHCGKGLPGFVECNCEKKFLQKDLWNHKQIGRRGKLKLI